MKGICNNSMQVESWATKLIKASTQNIKYIKQKRYHNGKKSTHQRNAYLLITSSHNIKNGRDGSLHDTRN